MVDVGSLVYAFAMVILNVDGAATKLTRTLGNVLVQFTKSAVPTLSPKLYFALTQRVLFSIFS